MTLPWPMTSPAAPLTPECLKRPKFAGEEINTGKLTLCVRQRREAERRWCPLSASQHTTFRIRHLDLYPARPDLRHRPPSLPEAAREAGGAPPPAMPRRSQLAPGGRCLNPGVLHRRLPFCWTDRRGSPGLKGTPWRVKVNWGRGRPGRTGVDGCCGRGRRQPTERNSWSAARGEWASSWMATQQSERGTIVA